jgi:hypothetical protein
MRVARFNVHQTAKAMAAIYALFGLVFVPFFLVANTFGVPVIPTWLVILGPLVYACFAYIFIAIGCLIYNFMAKFTGGVEFEAGTEAS